MLHFDPGSMKTSRRRKLAGYGYRAMIDGRLSELPAVGPRARKSEKQEACLHPPRVVLQSTDFDSVHISGNFASELNPPEDLFKHHIADVSGQIARERFVLTARRRQPREPAFERFRLP